MPENYPQNPENRLSDYATWEGTMIPHVPLTMPPQKGGFPTVPLTAATIGLGLYALLHGRRPKVPLFKGDLGYIAENEKAIADRLISSFTPPKTAALRPNTATVISMLARISRS